MAAINHPVPVNGKVEVLDAKQPGSDFFTPDVKGGIFTTTKGETFPVSKEQAKNYTAEEIAAVITIISDVMRGASFSEIDAALQKEVPYLSNMFQGLDAKIIVHTSGLDVPYLHIKNFPLPDRFLPKDKEDILISLANFPRTPPHGIMIRPDSVNAEKIASILDGHVYSSVIGSEEDYSLAQSLGYRWVCFHYADKKWVYIKDNPMQGDCLVKYIQLLFYALDGKYLN